MNTFTTQPAQTRVLMLGAGLDVKGGITSVEKLILENAPSNVKIHHVATFAQGSAIHNVRVFLKAAQTLLLTLLTGKADVIHIHFSERGSTFRKAILTLLALGFRKPVVPHSHGATYEEFFAKLPRPVQKFLALLFGSCTKFIVLSESWKAYFLENFALDESQIAVLHNPVKLPPAVPLRTGNEQVTFVFLGRIGKRGGALEMAKSVVAFPQQDKGAFDLIKAFAALPEKQRNRAKLVLAGNGDVEMAQQLVRELGIEERVTVLSWISPAERDELLANADAFVLPSYNEGLPMSMLEAMAWGLPAIVTPVGGIPEIISDRHNGLFVQPGNQQQLVQAMQSLIEDEGLRLALGAAGRNRVQSLDIKNYMSSLLQVYASAIAQDMALAEAPAQS
ncbi:glycosyltransferase family 4 protein [Kamptonema formosum]|uniref:glycosyltransferase family 4 protein n=1 Tax=Kamptonema formosum TaxID=331992 RepID=UPI000347B7A2|nr:glycosyltransferase family 4 protein [Oscillatoria sp. PCC 10802]